MNKDCYNAVIGEMKELLDQQQFVADGDIFKNEKKAIKVYYNDANKTFNLGVAEVVDGNVADFAVANSWLFDDDQTAKDAISVGVDFTDTLRKILGLKKSVRNFTNEISLPTTEKGADITVTTLTQKLLAIFPQFKDTYKEEVALYGRFLYIDFYAKYFIPEIKKMLVDKKSKKSVKKLFDMLEELYVQGDSATTDAVVMSIAAAAYGDKEATESAALQMAENAHMKTSVDEFTKRIKASKKLREIIIR